MVARAFFAAQASSAAAERLFSDLRRREGSKCQSSLTSTTEMCELIRVNVQSELQSKTPTQSGLLHPKREMLKKVTRKMAALVWKLEP